MKSKKNWFTIIFQSDHLDESYIIRQVMSTNVTKSTRDCVEDCQRTEYLVDGFT